MSVFIDMLVEMLPMASALQNKDNEFRKVLDYTIGAYMEDKEPVFDELFLSSATGGWLDAFGRDYGVSRRLDESDEDYRNRIIFEKLEYLTADNLKNIYGVELYNAVDGFNPADNNLTSDNPYMSNWYIGITDTDKQNILNNKFILDNAVVWYNGEILDYIFSTSNEGLLKQYLGIYQTDNATDYFKNNFNIQSVKLNLPLLTNGMNMFTNCDGLTSATLNLPLLTNGQGMFDFCIGLTSVDLNLPLLTNGINMFSTCIDLTSIDLDLPSLIDGSTMFEGCSDLVDVKLNFPKLEEYLNIFGSTGSIETIDVTIPNDIVTGFKSYVLNTAYLPNLTSLKINGVEYID